MGANLYSPGVIKTLNAKQGDHVQIISPHNNIVGYGKLELDPKEIAERKKGKAVTTIESVYKMPKLNELELFNQGFLFDQSLPSIIVGHLLSPDEKEKILDMCAAPGGKTTHIAQLINNKGQILACDRSKNRLKIIERNAKRLGLKNIKTLNIDARKLCLEYNLKFDKILLDPPCTALGHRPKLYDNINLEKSHSVSKYQKLLIRTASKLLKEDGLLAYSTCTLPYFENESVINYACKDLDLKIEDQKYLIFSRGEKIDNLSELEKCQRFYPDIHDSPGFFIALLKNRS
jgi:16S rRNA C967 or C1407 C5-methylase (RsmB/RsmF family)